MARWLSRFLFGAAIVLTQPDGSGVWVAESQVVSVRPTPKGMSHAPTLVTTVNGVLFVEETPMLVAIKLGWKK